MIDANHILDSQPAHTLEDAYEIILDHLKYCVKDLSVKAELHSHDIDHIAEILSKLREFHQAHECLTAKDVVAKFGPAKEPSA